MKNYFYNFNWLLLEKILRIFGGLLVGIWVARYLGPHDFGLINYALAFVAFFSWASHLGLNEIVVRELTKNPDKTNRILGSAFLMKFAGAILGIVLILPAISMVNPGNELVRLVIVLLSIKYVFQSFDVIDLFYQAKVLSKFTVFARSLAFLASSLLTVYFILGEFGVLYFALANTAELFLAAVFMIYVFVKSGNSVKVWRFDPVVAKTLFKYSWPLMASVFLINIHMKIDQFMIGKLLNIDEVGIYSVSVKLTESWYFIPAIITSTLMPYFLNLRESNKELYLKKLNQLLSLMFWIGVVAGVGTILVGQEVIVLLFGKEYARSYHALIFGIWGGIFIAQGMASRVWLISENLQIYRLYVQVMTVLVNLALNLLLIPILGISGAALATLISYFLATWVFGLFFEKTRPITMIMMKSSSPRIIQRIIKEKHL